MQIGSVQLDGNIALAPMAGVTDLPFRLLCREAGSAFAVTEMVSAKGYLCAASGNRATQALLLRAPQEGPVALQLFGKEPEVMAEAARRLSDRGFCMIDLNMGCPAPKIAGAGEGAALLKEPVLAARIVESVVRATHLPVTVKMRIGWDDAHRCAVPFARMIEASGAKAITVHGRTRMQFYAGMADWQAIAEVKAALQIPVWGNGDVASAMDAQRMQAQTGCDGVMIGRGAMGNPWIFSQIRGLQAGRSTELPHARERAQMALRHTRMLCAWKGESVALREMRKHIAWYLHGLRGAAPLRVQVNQACTLATLEDLLAPLLV